MIKDLKRTELELMIWKGKHYFFICSYNAFSDSEPAKNSRE